ncbi:uncharacterized protein EI90DRAFT_2528518 [Cantharellus anzutake]|uniref:uncharacterized protein n=1 Tax=Cantharellus anzutake TaxID=1750568 RepID=UPI001907F118|nr:uncharacterized protein EI90DRAFT_2528518 [Cantharellus anzutake]KAF8338000.1 hypothetical protein EI90DRAFT_2528518 [Cantharellus anzutake]
MAPGLVVGLTLVFSLSQSLRVNSVNLILNRVNCKRGSTRAKSYLGVLSSGIPSRSTEELNEDEYVVRDPGTHAVRERAPNECLIMHTFTSSFQNRRAGTPKISDSCMRQLWTECKTLTSCSQSDKGINKFSDTFQSPGEHEICLVLRVGAHPHVDTQGGEK